jgi:T-complex protein 1 subunit eta
MELSTYLHAFADRNVPHRQQAILKSFAKALEIIPRQLCDNAGFDATNILTALRVAHGPGGAAGGRRPSSSSGLVTNGATARPTSSSSQEPVHQIWAGVDFENEGTIVELLFVCPQVNRCLGIRDNMAAFVWEPAIVKTNALEAATEACCLILSVDETIKNQESEQPQGPQQQLPPGAAQRALRGRGRGMPRR